MGLMFTLKNNVPGCQQGNYIVSGIDLEWPFTTAGSIAEVRCPGGSGM